MSLTVFTLEIPVRGSYTQHNLRMLSRPEGGFAVHRANTDFRDNSFIITSGGSVRVCVHRICY